MMTSLPICEPRKFHPHLTRDDLQFIWHQAPRYLLISDNIYCHCVNIVIHHCLTHDEVEKVLNAYHGGACGGHLSGFATAPKIMCVE